jgi:hypothetical protein
MAKVSRSPADADADPFLEMIEARVAALQHLRTSYLAAKAAGAIGQTALQLPPIRGRAPASLEARASVESAPGRRTISGEVARLLSEAAHPMKARAIAAAVQRTGVVTSATSLGPTIHSILHRLKHRGHATRVPAGWVTTRSVTTPAIAGRFSGSASDATVIAPSVAPSVSAEPGRGAAATGPAQAMPAAPSVVRVPPHVPKPRAPRPRPAPGEPAADQRPGGLAWRIESLLRSHGKPVAARYVAQATGEPLNVVGLALGRMVRQQRVEKQSDGQFAVVLEMAEPQQTARKP